MNHFNTRRAAWAIAACALPLAACAPPHPHPARAEPRVITTLDCPAQQGRLKRIGAAGHGSTCDYADVAGNHVTLRLISLVDGDERAALSPLEAELQAELPAVKNEPATTAEPDDDRVEINLPGIHVHTSGNGHAEVNAMGVHVHASDRGVSRDADPATAALGGSGHDGVTINATPSGARILVNGRGPGIRVSYILAGDAPGPHGFRVVAYEARGPSNGPLAVATLLVKTDDHDGSRHDMKALLTRNVGA